MPVTVAAAVDDNVLIVLPLTVLAPVATLLIPVTAPLVEDKVLIALLFIVTVVVEGELQEIPITPLPLVEERLLIVLVLTERVVLAALLLPIVMAVSAAPQLILVIVLLLTELVLPI